MGFLDKLWKRSNNDQVLHLGDPALYDLFTAGNRSVAGHAITPENSLRISGWYAGIQIITGAVSSLPVITYRRLKNGGKERATDHPVYRLLHDQPNPWMTPTEYFENSQAHVLLWGNAFSFIESDGAGYPVALWPLDPSRMRMDVVGDRMGNRIRYFHYPENGGEVYIPQEWMLHVRGLARACDYSIWGYSPVDLAREQLGLAKAEEEYRARFFRNDAKPSGIIEYPGALTDKVLEQFKKDWVGSYAGVSNRHKVAFLEGGMKWHDVGFPPDVVQFIEGRRFQLEEIARILRIPLVLLQSMEKSTSWGSGIEQLMLGFVQLCIREWVKRWERRINVMLFSPREQATLFAEFLLKDLLRADSITEAQVLQIERRNGVISADDWRDITNRNPLPGGIGKKYVIEGNMTTLDKVGEDQAEPKRPNGGQPSEDKPAFTNGAAH